MKQTTSPTDILNFNAPIIQDLVNHRDWKNIPTVEAITSIYNFVRDEIEFGYNLTDEISASQVLEDGYGQCNTKATLLMALLSACDIPNRIHGFTIDKELQKGAITGLPYLLSPRNILHSWVEVELDGEWYHLEGVILDRRYLQSLQRLFGGDGNTLCGYGAYTDHLENPVIDFNRNHTYIQALGINQDFGLFDTPDEFYAQHGQELSPVKQWLYRNVIRHLMNRNVARIRKKL